MAEEKITTTTAVAKGVHISARKTRLVADLIRGKSAAESVVILQNLPKKAAKSVMKVVLSAVANAQNNHQLDKDRLFVSAIKVDEGQVMKRYMPRAYGRASMIRRPTSHITVVLEEKEGKSKKAGMKFPIIPKREKKVKEEGEDQEKKVKNVAEEIVSGKMQDNKEGQAKEKASKKGFLGRAKKTEVTRKGGEK